MEYDNKTILAANNVSHHTHSVKNFFDKTENYLDNTFGVKIRTHIVGKLAGEYQGKRVLDVGCGNGMVTMVLSGNNELVLVDVSDSMISLARKNYQKYAPQSKVTFINQGLDDIRLEGKFDLIVAFGLLAHLENISLTLAKLSSLLSHSGKLILQFSPAEKLTNKLWLFMAKNKINYKINPVYSSGLSRIVDEVGLSVLQEISYGIMVPGVGKLPHNWLCKINMFLLDKKIFKFIHTEKVWLLAKKEPS